MAIHSLPMRPGSRRGPAARLVLFAAAIGLFAVSYYWGNRYRYSGAPPVVQGVLIRPPPALPDFELQDAGGLPFGAADLRGHWTLFAFADLTRAQGHLAATRMIDIYHRLTQQAGLRGQLRFALAVAPPAPDLARDFASLTRALKVLSGEPGELQRLRAALGEAPATDAAPPDDDAPFYLIDPKGRLLALFPGALAPTTIAADLAALAGRPDPRD